MTPDQLAHNQQQRLEVAKPHVALKVRHCRYCKTPLVRLRTIARCYEIREVDKDFVTWVDEKGKVQKTAILTLDHVLPKSKGGGKGKNIVPACRPCNEKKADKIGKKLHNGEIVILEEAPEEMTAPPPLKKVVKKVRPKAKKAQPAPDDLGGIWIYKSSSKPSTSRKR